MPSGPYCSHCGHSLVSEEGSQRCPGCGRPASEVLTRDPVVRGRGKRWKSDIVLLGLPLVHIAQGPYGDQRIGRARGIIAVGDVAVGWLACGGVAVGIVAFGGVSIGLVSLGGLALGLLALGGAALGGAVLGGAAIGGIALGGGAIGYVAQGGGALGHYARGGGAFGTFVETAGRSDPQAAGFFNEWAWLLGSNPAQMHVFALWLLVGALAIASLFALVVLLAYVARPRECEYR